MTSSPPATPTLAPGARRRASIRRFRSDQDGATAVEFAFVALPFFALLLAILEGGLVFWTNQVLETAVEDASRRLFTGQFQKANTGLKPSELGPAFKDLVCQSAGASTMIDCSKLKVDVQTAGAFPQKVSSPIVTDDQGNRKIDDKFGAYANPAPQTIVVVRVAVEYPVFVSLLDANKSNLTPTTRLLMASAAFRTEPY